MPDFLENSQFSKRVTSGETTKDRIEHLDSCRGIAAAMVVCSHCLQAMDVQKIYATEREVLGHLPVLFFFILSGYVLGRSLERDEHSFLAISRYSIRRFFRLFPALMIVMLLSFILSKSLTDNLSFGLSLSDWARNLIGWMAQVTTANQLGQNLLLIQRGLDVPTWTIKVEVVCSLLLPLLLWICRSWAARIAATLILVVYSLPVVQSALHLDGTSLTVAECTKYLYLFFLGALLNSDIFYQKNRSIKIASIAVIALIGFLLMKCVIFRFSDELGNALVIFLILLSLLHIGDSPLKRMLLSRGALFLGTISYSFYLLHAPIMCFMLSHMPERFWTISMFSRFAILFLLVAVVSLLVGTIVWRWVESPLNRLGHRISKRLLTTIH